jgi:hypothetical protein
MGIWVETGWKKGLPTGLSFQGVGSRDQKGRAFSDGGWRPMCGSRAWGRFHIRASRWMKEHWCGLQGGGRMAGVTGAMRVLARSRATFHDQVGRGGGSS